MTPERCPGCGTKLSPEMLACPNCPMSFPEDDPSGTGVNPLKQSPYWNFVLPAMFFGALALGIWYIAIGLFHLGEENAKSVDEKPNFMRSVAEEKAAAAKAAAAREGGEETTSEGAVFEPASPGAGPSSVKAKSAAGSDTTVISITPADAEPSSGSSAPPSPKAAPREWKLRGRVYDLATLKPLAGVSMEFVDESSNTRRRTRTDASGAYRTIVPALDGRGYTVKAEKAGYSPNYLDPATPGVRELTPADRRALSKDLAATLSATPATVAAESAEPLVTDFYLAPRP